MIILVILLIIGVLLVGFGIGILFWDWIMGRMK